MADADQTKSIHVSVLGRTYALRVQDEDEAFTRKVAAFVDDRMKAFKESHPEQAELTTAVVTALAIAEDLHELREEVNEEREALNGELDRLAGRLASAVASEEGSDG